MSTDRPPTPPLDLDELRDWLKEVAWHPVPAASSAGQAGLELIDECRRLRADLAACRAESDRYRTALEQIAHGVWTREWSPSSNGKSDVARAALEGAGGEEGA